MTSFSDVVADVRALAGQGDTAGAISLLDTRRSSFPRQLGWSYLVEAELRAAAGEHDAALASLDRALSAGCRYRKEWLLENTRLAPLAQTDALRQIAERAQLAYDEAATAAKPHLMFAMPDTLPDAFGYPLLMVLHGNNSDAKETAPFWSGMADRGWVVAVPQSSEIGMTPGAFTWNDRARTASELDLHFDRVKKATQVDMSRIVLAGFSMGATQAIGLALQKRFTVRGVISVAGWMPRIDEYRELIERGTTKMLRMYVLVGEHDPSVQGARDLVAALQEHKMRAELDERPGLDHDYPDDMDATLVRALEFVTK